MANKNARALSDKELDNASGGFIHQDRRNRWEVYDNKGNIVQTFNDRWDAIKAAKSRGYWEDEIYDNELKDFKTNMQNNGYVDVSGKRYYIDGHSASLKE